MTQDELANVVLTQVNEELAVLNSEQRLLYDYLGAMRQLPAYLSFCEREPNFGNAELILKIAMAFRGLVVSAENCPDLNSWVGQLDREYVPSTDDFGSDSAAMEAGIAFILLNRFVNTQEASSVFEIFRGIVECALMIDDRAAAIRVLSREDLIRRRQFELISASPTADVELLDACLAKQRADS